MTARESGRRRLLPSLALVVCLVVAGGVAAATLRPPHPGPRPNGTGITPEGWRITPAGTQTALGNGPLAMAASPDGSLIAVPNAGYAHNALSVVRTVTGDVSQRIWSADARPTGYRTHGYYAGVVFGPKGRRAFASDGPGSSVHVYAVHGQTLTEQRLARLPGGTWPAGLAISGNGRFLFVAANLSDELLVLDTRTRKVVRRVRVGHLPYAVALNRSERLAYVANWGGHTVSVVDVADAAQVARIPVGLHPSAVALNPTRAELYVANTDSDTVSVIDTRHQRVLRTIDLRPYAGAHVGASPDALAVSPDGHTLYVADAGDNDVAVVKLGPAGSTSGLDRVRGLIPTGWFPTGLSLTGSQLFVVNMYGLGTGPVAPGQYIAAQMRGTLSTIPLPDATTLAAYTAQVDSNDGFGRPPPGVPGNPVPAHVGDPSPIKHVIYVMKENRTYDQILGDMRRGNGDPHYVMYPRSITPNQHALARRFVTLDNFYTDGAVSADGWSWSTEAYANTYVDKNWPQDYGYYGRRYDFGGFDNNETAGLPGTPDGSFLWDRLAQAHISYRNYGFFMDGPKVNVPASMPHLEGHTDPHYPGWNLNIADATRMDAWMREFHHYIGCSCLPTMEFVYLPQDHTMGTATLKPKPTAMIADNDLALGRLVQAVSHSKYWSSTAIFVVEDDAQDGPDHVSGHRTLAQVISPYTQHGKVDSTLYSTVSMLRTMELILGLQPLTQFDAAAMPMYPSFTSTPNRARYDSLTPSVSITARNGPHAPMAAASRELRFSRPDASPEELLNRILWFAARHAPLSSTAGG